MDTLSTHKRFDELSFGVWSQSSGKLVQTGSLLGRKAPRLGVLSHTAAGARQTADIGIAWCELWCIWAIYNNAEPLGSSHNNLATVLLFPGEEELRYLPTGT